MPQRSKRPDDTSLLADTKVEGPRGLDLLTPLADKVRVRGLDPGDATLLTDHLLRLPARDLSTRFHGGMSDDSVRSYVARINWRDTLIFGAFIEGQLRAVAELILPARGAEGEVAVSVEAPFQRMGLGRVLVLAAILAARRVGLQTIRLTYQPRNFAMRALAAELGAKSAGESQQIDGVVRILQRGENRPGA
ncbi:GNAT family N-acetyltransferase [Paracoccus albicereus]|uniref:GNAT family N-acetyltransferase n=1 Tax=Paracoccus albicereus TaxID=2922394 RepID=UPI0021017B29|nr:GNAT family N-acetyltransferase [Paracoccus albicereus]